MVSFLRSLSLQSRLLASIGGLGPRDTFLVVGAVPKLEVPPYQLIGGNQSMRGWYSGTAGDSQDTLQFSVLAGVRSLGPATRRPLLYPFVAGCSNATPPTKGRT